jgi:hypothetical protein
MLLEKLANLLNDSGGERGIRTLEVHASSITYRLLVALRARVARVLTAPWPMLAHEPDSYGKLHGEPENDSERRVLDFGNRRKPISSGPLNQFPSDWLYRTFPKSTEKFLSTLCPRSLSVNDDDCEFWKLL